MTLAPTMTDAELIDRLTPPDGPVSVVLDTDAYNEVDDQFAVTYALGSPEVDLEAIYAAPFHNDRSSGPADGMERSYREIERLLERAPNVPESGPPVVRGAEAYMSAADEPVENPASTDLIERAHATEDTLYVVAIGCPVNVASAILLDPSIREEIVVVWLGGQPHDWPTADEFNLSQDRHASRVLFDCGVPLVQIPCKNVAQHVRTTVPELAAYIDGHSPLGTYLYRTFADHNDGDPSWWSKEIWDLAAVAWVVDPSLVWSNLAPSPILTDDLTWSRDPDRHRIRVAGGVIRDRIFRDFEAALDRIA